MFLLLLFEAGTALAASPGAFEMKVQADSLLKQGQAARSILLYEKVLQQNPRLANAYYNLATAYYLEKKLEKAIQNLESFVSLEPNDAEALYNLGCLKLRMGHFEDARDCFLTAKNCPSAQLVSQKIKEALRFTKDLQSEKPETRELLAYLITA